MKNLPIHIVIEEKYKNLKIVIRGKNVEKCHCSFLHFDHIGASIIFSWKPVRNHNVAIVNSVTRIKLMLLLTKNQLPRMNCGPKIS